MKHFPFLLLFPRIQQSWNISWGATVLSLPKTLAMTFLFHGADLEMEFQELSAQALNHEGGSGVVRHLTGTRHCEGFQRL